MYYMRGQSACQVKLDPSAGGCVCPGLFRGGFSGKGFQIQRKNEKFNEIPNYLSRAMVYNIREAG
jgi:hypothetical protein